ncbi:MAG: hypothetical protein A2571_03150 [Candidatus Vogelbacteria bacterium RIFOXYD1_FULL_44_32]|uniref:FAD-dependent oxidoreductase n=1 Tax=Candidatus Vogelbacteria bacterium RIFOXYD1_FULL_44_32 TaxID=1802438 RepID=A0A1G2QDT8_9BACT|nr:MAG: hypothetical protein A2571_03150 [Candidatus Vogelbacteria bacterium RIFOXYD1_FULL_44_32]
MAEVKIYDLIVIGGGASGMMAAGRAAERGKSVLLLEKNKKLGEKLKITGGGRCNITNAEEDEHILLKKYGLAEPFLYSTFAQFGVSDTFKFFERHGLPLVVQAGQRVFPQTEKADDVFKVLEKYLTTGKVVVKVGQPVTAITKEGNKIKNVVVGQTEYSALHYILATGGVSHPATGSTGDGFTWLAKLGHTVIPPSPTIVPLSVSDQWVKSSAGVTLVDMKITFYVDGVKKFNKRGSLLFTHFGLSGPLILNSAKKVSDLLHEGVVTATIDLFPTLDLGELEKKVVAIFDNNKNKSFKNVLKDILPAGLASSLLGAKILAIEADKKMHSVTKEERKALVRQLKFLPLTITGLMGLDRAVVADGGVSLAEIDMRTMQSKIINNLSLTGDLLHITRPSGGYSLQLCWTTGYVAGSNN